LSAGILPLPRPPSRRPEHAWDTVTHIDVPNEDES
jgi:hypothetical protein